MARVRATEDMVRILIYNSDDSRNAEGVQHWARMLSHEVGGASNYIPRMYYLAPDKTPLAYVDYEQKQEATPEGEKVAQIFQWVAGVERDLERADRMAERGRFTEAMREVDEIVEQDAKVSHLIQQMLGHAEEGDAMPDTPASPMFEGLLEEKRSEFEAIAQAQLDEARALAEQEEYRNAQRVLRNLVRGPEDFATTEPAKALLEEIQEKMRG